MEKLLVLVDDNERFEYTPEGTDAVIVYRRLGADAVSQIKRRHTKTKINRKSGQPYQDTDWETVGRDMLDQAILEWRGIKGDLPCTRENKLRLPGSVRAELMDLVDEAKVSGEETRKNCSPSSGSQPLGQG